MLCTYCGSLSVDTGKCSNCGGHFDLLSRQRTQNAMGPWYIRDQVNPFHPGCSYDTLRRLVARGRIKPDTILRGPTTRQFWSFAKNTPGVAHLLGSCHACHEPAQPGELSCKNCNASFSIAGDRQHLGLAPTQFLPGDADPAAVVAAAFGPEATPPPTNASDGFQHSINVTGVQEDRGQPAHGEPTEAPVSPSTGRVGAARRRRKSAMPLIAVGASVVCAAAVLIVLVVVTRPTAGPTPSAESDRAIAQRPDQAREPLAPVITTDFHEVDPQDVGSSTTDQEHPVVRNDAETLEASADIASPAADAETEAQEESESVELDESGAADVDGNTSRTDSEAAGLATMTLAELRDHLRSLPETGTPERANPGYRRLTQLELRAAFRGADGALSD